MPLNRNEILKALSAFAELGDEARDLYNEIKISREDGAVTPDEKRLRNRAVKSLARQAGPIVLQLALDAMD